jgi:sigma-B regulation protein RsbU (phosphoserine phosphatase)
MLLGVSEDCQYQEQSLLLEQGDTLVAYTDGVVETGNRVSDPFGRSGLLRAVQQSTPSHVEELARDVVAAVERHVQGNRPQDDLTVLAATVSGPDQVA